ncbi:MAG: hypothetical protein V4655_14550 [Bdellovibrionota bacterium]
MGSRPYIRFYCLSALVVLSLMGTGCSFFEKTESKSGGKQGAGSGVLGASLGAPASGEDAEQLTALYGVATTHAPAPVRPDPDLIVRNLLLQYRESGSTVAREIGRVEEFRMLLGGANVTFTVTPQETYDSTSLLAEMKVAGEICRSLINPSSNDHPGWATILPAEPTKLSENLSFLAQRFLGVPTDRIDPVSLETLTTIVNASKKDGAIKLESYIPACVTLVLDAEALLL